MASFVRKTYGNSYLYSNNSDEMNRHNRVLTDFILKADRIEKSSEAFQGIIDAVKRGQRSNILYTVLLRDDVVLCMRTVELPRAFKVFEAKDIREKGNSKTFIDVTGLIKLNGNYFDCKNISVLVTYLFSALTYILYRDCPIKLTNNSNITISGTECYVSIVNYIIDYLRIIGYSANKDKILYLTGLFFLYNLMGKDIDNYSRNIAAKISGISTTNIRSLDLYFDPEKDFINIDSFITLIAETFKLKGLTTEVFLHQWIYLMGEGTQFCTELFTSFSTLITSAYCGSYVVNQKQIERCCAKSMVTYATSLLKLGSEEITNSFNESNLEKMIYREPSTLDLAKSLSMRDNNTDELKFTKEDFKSYQSALEKADNIINYYERCNHQIDKISLKAKYVIIYMIDNIDSDEIDCGIIGSLYSKFCSYINNPDKESIIRSINYKISSLEGAIESCEENNDFCKNARKSIIELYKFKNLI